MRLVLTALSYFLLCCVCTQVLPASDHPSTSSLPELPPMETFLFEPIILENIGIWVPAAKFGPEINSSCKLRTGYSYSAALAAAVSHTKTESCPQELARLLAEYGAAHHPQSLPMTIFDGWRWESPLTLCQFESVSFDLVKYGGCWEGSWEAILIRSTGSVGMQCVRISQTQNLAAGSDDVKPQSSIEITTFNSMRARDGYPKKQRVISR
ncbi:MAG TPA: hypothetical protein VMX13_00630 [Sedimentisphaerales bacterium]|nr:hypothetical protein [Sedimentisphaerales bacterium]